MKEIQSTQELHELVKNNQVDLLHAIGLLEQLATNDETKHVLGIITKLVNKAPYYSVTDDWLKMW